MTAVVVCSLEMVWSLEHLHQGCLNCVWHHPFGGPIAGCRTHVRRFFAPPTPAPPKRSDTEHSFLLKYKIFDTIFDSNTNFNTIWYDSNTNLDTISNINLDTCDLRPNPNPCRPGALESPLGQVAVLGNDRYVSTLEPADVQGPWRAAYIYARWELLGGLGVDKAPWRGQARDKSPPPSLWFYWYSL